MALGLVPQRPVPQGLIQRWRLAQSFDRSRAEVAGDDCPHLRGSAQHFGRIDLVDPAVGGYHVAQRQNRRGTQGCAQRAVRIADRWEAHVQHGEQIKRAFRQPLHLDPDYLHRTGLGGVGGQRGELLDAWLSQRSP